MGRRGRKQRLGQRGEEMWGGTERQQWWQNGHGLSHIHGWWVKIGRDILGAKDPSRRPDHTAQGFSTRKTNPHNF